MNEIETTGINKPAYIGCKSWRCRDCRFYQKFLSVSTMQMICWNKGCFYETNTSRIT